MVDYYKILGVSPTASIDEVTLAYRKLRSAYHTDKSADDSTVDKFIQIQNAYEAIKNTVTLTVLQISLEDAYTGARFPINNGYIDISPGVTSGATVKVKNKLYKIEIIPHKKFKRSGNDLLVDVTITHFEAIIGIMCKLQHLDGRYIDFPIPQWIGNNQIIKLSKEGMPDPYGNSYGDLLVRVNVCVPDVIDRDVLDILKELPHRNSVDL